MRELKYKLIENIYKKIMSDRTPTFLQYVFLNKGVSYIVSSDKEARQG